VVGSEYVGIVEQAAWRMRAWCERRGGSDERVVTRGRQALDLSAAELPARYAFAAPIRDEVVRALSASLCDDVTAVGEDSEAAGCPLQFCSF